MGRKLEFNKSDALMQAMESFWAKGYDATSMRDLAGKLGLHLGSVYNALGDKEQVFETSLKLHYENHALPRLQAMDQESDALAAITRIVREVADECGGATPSPGCFIINSLLDISDINDSITQTLKGYLDNVQKTLVRTIKRGQAQGTITQSADADALGDFVLGNLFALRVMGKLKSPSAMINNIASGTIAAIKCAT